MGCEFGKVVCEIRNVVCEFRNRFVKFAMWFANFAMRNFAKLLQWVCEMHSILQLLFHCSLHPAASHPASTASHFLHFALVFSLILGLFDG